MRISTLLMGILLVATSQTSTAMQPPGCSPEESMRLESKVASIKDWNEVYDSFNTEHACTG